LQSLWCYVAHDEETKETTNNENTVSIDNTKKRGPGRPRKQIDPEE